MPMTSSSAPPDYADDLALLGQIEQRDQAALSALYDRYSTRVYSLALRVVNNAVLAEEITQDTFLKVWKDPRMWQPERGQFSSWLLTVTRYTAIDRLRREVRVSQNALSLDAFPVEINPTEVIGGSADTSAGRGEAEWSDSHTIRTLLAKLPPEQRQAVELAFFHGLTHTQLSERLGLPLGTVKTRVKLGLQKLRALWHTGETSESG